MTADQLREQALRHVDRYRPTVWQLTRVLRRRVDKRGGAVALADQVVAELVASGVVDDDRVAADWVRTLHRRGMARPAMRQRLRQKGLSAEVTARALGALDDGPGDADLAAALNYARRRRLGPFRREARVERRQRDLATMARAGFRFSLCRQVVDTDDLAHLEALAVG